MRILFLVLLTSVAVQLSGCGDVQCDTDADCASGEVCAEAGGVLFQSRICVSAEMPNMSPDTSISPDMGADANDSDACVPRSAQDLCASLRAECGSPTVTECGTSVDLNCGRCERNEACNGEFECQCVPESNEDFCSRFGADCGEISNLDNCGENRTVNCGTCTGTDMCGEFQANVCGCPCEIEGVCYPADAVNPDNPCLRCSPEVADDQWTNAQGTPCSDGDLCTENDVCTDGGICEGTVVDCQPTSPCQNSMCNPMNGACVESPIPDGQACGEDDGLFCTNNLCFDGMCVTQIDSNACLIENVCYDDNETNPAAECEICRPFETQLAWSLQNPGRKCGEDGLSCTEGQCDAMGTCVIEIDNGDCLIDGQCINDNNANPLNECEECLPNQSQTTWSPANTGQSCGDPANGCECDAMASCVDSGGAICN